MKTTKEDQPLKEETAMSKRMGVMFLTIGLLLGLGSIATAQNTRKLGTSESGFHPAAARPLQISPTAVWTNASYGTGGVALRNRNGGAIQISGVNGPVQAAYIYWAVLLGTSSPSKALLNEISEVQVLRIYPAGLPASVQVKGTLLNVGGDPCWGSSGAWVYRGLVPTDIATGNGIYRVELRSGASGLTDGEDPWDGNVVFPLFEGASLVIVGTGSSTVGLFDGQAGTTFEAENGFTATYNLPAAFQFSALFDNFGYDGQIGASRTIEASNETTTVEGLPSAITVEVVGNPGGVTGDSDWDGSSGWPLPQLWDDTGHDISNAFAQGDTQVVVSFGGPSSDCVGTVGSVLAIQ
jgi:hypothetical protein